MSFVQVQIARRYHVEAVPDVKCLLVWHTRRRTLALMGLPLALHLRLELHAPLAAVLVLLDVVVTRVAAAAHLALLKEF